MKYLEIAPERKRGENWDGISNSVDYPECIYYDLRNLPIHNIEVNTYDVIYNEHFIEHLTRDEGVEFFKEMFRILKNGGTIRVVWPSMDFIDYLKSDKCSIDDEFVNLYLKNLDFYPRWKPKGIQNESLQNQCALTLLYQGGEHKHLWYKNEMIKMLIELGFENVSELPYNQSNHIVLNGIDKNERLRELHSTVIEAVKP